MDELWQEALGKAVSPAVKQVLMDIRESQHRLLEEVAALKARDAVAEQSIARILAGFPANDLDGHRRYHEAVIEWRELRNKMVREALIKMAGAGAIGGIGWLLYAVWNAIKLSVKQ